MRKEYLDFKHFLLLKIQEPFELKNDHECWDGFLSRTTFGTLFFMFWAAFVRVSDLIF